MQDEKRERGERRVTGGGAKVQLRSEFRGRGRDERVVHRAL